VVAKLLDDKGDPFLNLVPCRSNRIGMGALGRIGRDECELSGLVAFPAFGDIDRNLKRSNARIMLPGCDALAATILLCDNVTHHLPSTPKLTLAKPACDPVNE
jgi:hypothetical protein